LGRFQTKPRLGRAGRERQFSASREVGESGQAGAAFAQNAKAVRIWCGVLDVRVSLSERLE